MELENRETFQITMMTLVNCLNELMPHGRISRQRVYRNCDVGGASQANNLECGGVDKSAGDGRKTCARCRNSVQ